MKPCQNQFSASFQQSIQTPVTPMVKIELNCLQKGMRKRGSQLFSPVNGGGGEGGWFGEMYSVYSISIRINSNSVPPIVTVYLSRNLHVFVQMQWLLERVLFCIFFLDKKCNFN